MTQVVNRRRLTAESRLPFRVSLCELCAWRCDSATEFSQSTNLYPLSVSFHESSNARLHLSVARKINRRKLGTSHWLMLFCKSRELCVQNYCHFVYSSKVWRNGHWAMGETHLTLDRDLGDYSHEFSGPEKKRFFLTSWLISVSGYAVT